jgi:outer membrane protein assembly factor BamB
MAGGPGVLWAQAESARQSLGLGEIQVGGWLALDGDRLVSFDLSNGRTLWEQVLEEDENVDSALLDPDGRWVYTVDQLGLVQQYELTGQTGGVPLVQRWEIDLEVVGRPGLLPLPGGGIILLMPRTWAAVSAEGDLLWERPAPGGVEDWIELDRRLNLAVRGEQRGIYQVDQTGLVLWVPGISGRLVAMDDVMYVYDGLGVHRLTPGSDLVEPVYTLPSAYPRLGDMAVSPAGELVLAHSDREDRRILALDSEGRVLWERSIADVSGGDFRLVLSDGRVYLALWNLTSREDQLKLFAISKRGEILQLIFRGGTRTPYPAGAWLEVLSDERLLIRIGGGGLALLDPAQAQLGLNVTE